MCGISGIVSPSAEIDIERLKKMNKVIAHRGPDNNSFFINKHVALGHRRLSIIDLNSRSNQPMKFKNLNIVFNGEIYNYKIIREKLKNKGYIFETEGDCEVVIKAYDFWGEECTEMLNGMWAFIIFDENKENLFCSRDRFGIKPFYYKFEEDNLYFGSEIKQLLGENCEPEMKNIVDYIFASYVDHNELTFFKDVFQLLPSHNMSIQLNNNDFDIKIYQYFYLDKLNKDLSHENINQLLDKSIKDHLVSDVKVGSCLSGGLDSSYVNNIMSKNLDNITAIHCNSTDLEFSEVDKATKVANSLNLNLEIVEPRFEDFKKDIDRLFYIQEQPFGDPSVYMQYKVMEKANDLGIKVMVDGQGADEVFMGYSKYLGSKIAEDIISLKWFSAIKFLRQSMKRNNLSFKSLIKLD